MNSIEKMIHQMCPDGVQWRELGEICDIKNGYTPYKNNTEYWKNGEISWFRLEDIRTNGRMLNEAIQKVSMKAIKGKLFEADSIIMSTTATIGVTAIITVPFICNQQFTVFTIKDKSWILTKYLFYYFDTISKELSRISNSSCSIKIINMKSISKIKIPIPPIEIQEKIAKTLDKFTKYVTELQNRHKQYEYFRNLLLSENYLIKLAQNTEIMSENDKTVKWTTLGDIGEFVGGFGMPKTMFEENGQVGAIHYSHIYIQDIMILYISR